jgi:hypothetical protein
MALIDDLRAAKQELSSKLLQRVATRGLMFGLRSMPLARITDRLEQNLHAIGIGLKMEDGKATRQLCVRFYVANKLPKSLIALRDRLPKTIAKLPTDVIESPPAFLLAGRRAKGRKPPVSRRAAVRETPLLATEALATPSNCSLGRRLPQRPIYPGISISHQDVTVGTLACMCRSTRVGDDPTQAYVLSNNHVLANLNSAALGDVILQPGRADSGNSSHVVAKLARFIPLLLNGQGNNRVDCAIAAVKSTVAQSPAICKVGRVTGVADATVNLLVCKHGRTTGYTEGKVVDVSYDAIIGLDPSDSSVNASFVDQIRIDATEEHPVVGLGGDSGSLVVDRNAKQAVGLYFAGPDSGEYGVANHIGDVFDKLEIELL